MLRRLFLAALFVLVASHAYATPPATCVVNQGWHDITTTSDKYYVCTATNTWTLVHDSTQLFPSGFIIGILSGTCPTGWTEVAALAGRVPRGTVAASANVGTTGGSDSYTPAGTNAAITAGTPSGTNSTATTSGNCAATNIAAGTGSTTACKATAPNLLVPAETFTGAALPTHTHTFTGTPATVVPAYVNMIFCSKN